MMSNIMGYQQQTSYPAPFGATPSMSIPATDEEIAAIENAELMKKLGVFSKEMQRGRQTGTENEKIKWWKTQPRCSRCKGHNVTCKPKSGSWAVRCGSCISNPNDGPCSNVDDFRQWRIKQLLHLTDAGYETLLQEHKKQPPPPVQAKAEPLSDSEMNLVSTAQSHSQNKSTRPARASRANVQQHAQASGSMRTGSESPLSDTEGAADTDAAFRVPAHMRVDPHMLPSRAPSSRLAVLSRPGAEDFIEPRSPRRHKQKLLTVNGASFEDAADSRTQRDSISIAYRPREPLEPFMAPLIQPDDSMAEDIPDEVIPLDIPPEELRRQLAETRKKLKQQERACQEQQNARADAQRRYEASQYLLQAKTDRTVARENELNALQQRVADLTATREKDRMTHAALRRNITDIIRDRDQFRKETHRLRDVNKDLQTQIAVLQQMGGTNVGNDNQTVMVDERHNGRVEGLSDILQERTRLREELRDSHTAIVAEFFEATLLHANFARIATQHSKTPLESAKLNEFLESHQARLEETYMRLMQMAPDDSFTDAMDNVRRGKPSTLNGQERSEGPAKKRKLDEAC